MVEKVFTAQSVHTDEADAEKDPVLHALHVIGVDAPSTSEAVPPGQSMQTVPSLLEYVPLPHLSTRRIVFDPTEMSYIGACEMSVCELIPVPPVPSILTSIFRNWEDVS